ncbi:4-aminobutyrate--2-oxoglutarate transaminase [Kyrpidia tusciae]|uniref:(S)-3-amino-2-methylpropionate transaminase n=1 Tax=Kyrpidia tusciae (strain DSM 2912 / NBRC 15312 / T2) TaxID=562970 RepID=D5WT36_KYRT2|nr:4-aminobutyrate--2-oxoglutarate transaminase [Kyrpidia tusciae]ADG05140.1 4-aminobutyrate aminotransferase [Kyrpidia tusciae DSM 2912]
MTRRFIDLKTPIPGPKSQALMERRKARVPRGVSNATPIFVDRAEGALVTDVDGNTFLDFAGAIGTMNAGHRPPAVVKALHEQVDRFLHTSFHVAMYESYVALAEKLAELTPGNFEKKAMFLNSGAEAVENAIKIARRYTGRPAVVSFTRGFHGRTLMGMSLTSKVKPYKYQMGPFAPMVYQAPYPYVYRRPAGMSEEEYTDSVIAQFKEFFSAEVSPEEVAAVIFEPVQGEGGFIVPPKRFVDAVKEFCAQHRIVFIADEIQTGFGRTGRWFASEHFGLEPDLITVSKSLAAGLPISGVVGRAEIMDAAEPGQLGGTYGGSPLGCAAALGVIETMQRENLVQKAEVLGRQLIDRFTRWYERYPLIGDVRGLGAMAAVELVRDRQTREPAKDETARVIQGSVQRGVLLMGAGLYSDVIRILCPLVTTPEELDEGLDVVEEALAEVSGAVSTQQA